MKKRILSTLLALCMMLSILPGTALAAETGGKQEVTAQPLDDGGISEDGQVSNVGTEDSAAWEIANPEEGSRDEEDSAGERGEELPPFEAWDKEDGNAGEADLLGGGGDADLSRADMGTYTPYEGASYALRYSKNDDGTITITGYTGTVEGELVLPEMIEGKMVTVIGRVAFSGCKNLQQVTMPSGLEEIGFAAFRNCTGLTGTLTLPVSLVDISEEAFSGCTGLTGTLTIPDAVIEIGKKAFEGCTGVEKLVLGRSVEVIGIRAFSSCSNLRGTLSIPETVREIKNMAFQYCTNLQEIVLQEGLTSVGFAAFRGCKSFTAVSFPNSCIRIGEKALDPYDDYHAGVFAECSNLEKVVFPTTVEYLNTYYLFYNCPKLEDPLLPDGTTFIDEGAFECCSSITNLVLPDTLKSIGSQKYSTLSSFTGCDNLERVVIPDSVVDLRCSFSNCQKLHDLELPKNVEGNYSADSGWIGTYENDVIYLTDCINLERIEIPYGISELPTAMFYNCTNLKEVYIPTSVVKISGYNGSYSPAYGAFENCTALNSINLPNSINTIECGAFSNCTNLKSITIPDSVTKFCKDKWDEYVGISSDQHGVFEGCISLETVILPAEMDIICMNMFRNCMSLSSIEIPASVSKIDISAFSGCSSLSNITIPNSVVEIGSSAFSGCSGLTGNLIIPDSVTTIGSSAFSDCSGFVGNLVIPDGVTQIGYSAFSGCSGFTGSLTIPDSVSKIGGSAFSGCNGLTGSLAIGNGITQIDASMFMGCNNFTGDLTIGNNVTEIGNSAFSGRSFTGNLVIPDSVTTIDSYAFSGCSGFTGDLVIPDSVIKIGYSAFSSCSGFTGSLTIGNRVTEIGSFAFYGCTKLTHATIPNSVTSINASAFSGCYDLKFIFFSGDEQQWNTITGGLSLGSNITVIYGASNEDIPAASGTTLSFKEKYYVGTTGTEIFLWADLLAGQDNCQTLADSLTWTSSNEAVFPISAKNTTALVYSPTTGEVFCSGIPTATGVSTVTVTTADGASSSCTVTVSEGKLTFSVPGETYTVQTGKSGVVYVDIATPNDTGLSWTWTSSDSNIVSFDQDKVVGTVDELHLDSPGRNPYHFSSSIKFYGRSPGTATLTCTSEDGKASASRTVVVVGADIQARTIESNHYNVPKYIDPSDVAAKEQIALYYADWYETYEKYIEALRSALGKAQDNNPPSLEDQARALMAADQKSRSKYLTFPAGFPGEWKILAYQELCGILEDAAEKKIDLSSVNLKDEFSASSSIVNQIANNISSVKKREAYGNVQVNVSCGNYLGASFGSMTFSRLDQKWSREYTVTICSTMTSMNALIADYLNQLRVLEVKAVNKIYSAIAKDILGKSITDLKEDYLKRKFTPKIEAKFVELHLGTPYKILTSCHSYYKQYNKIYKGLKGIGSMDWKDLEDAFKAMEFDDSTVTDKATKNAVGVMKKAQEKLNDAIYEYLVTGKVSPPKKGWGDCILSLFKCPVSVSVYRDNVLLGYVGTDNLWYNENEIIIEEKGGAKYIYSKPGDQLSFIVTGDTYGTMDYTVEEYANDEPTGRINFYGLPLSNDAVYATSLPSGTLKDSQDTITLDSNGVNIEADEYISAAVNARVVISATTSDSGQGMVFGDGEYVRGDAVVLRAIEEDGFVFLGWYDEINNLVSINHVYEFTAQEDQVLTARFAENTLPVDRITATVSMEDTSVIELNDPGSLLAGNPIVLAAKYRNEQMVDLSVGILSENYATVTFSGKSIGDDWVLFFLTPGQWTPICPPTIPCPSVCTP